MSEILSFRAPASKSVTQRALVISALTPGRSDLINPLECDDSRHLRKALRMLGVEIEEREIYWRVKGGILHTPNDYLWCGDAGTTLRFLMAFSLLIDTEVTLDGSAQIRKRPIGEFGKALRQLGVEVKYLKEEGKPPVKLFRKETPKSTVSISLSESSQPASALLMVAPLLPYGMVIVPESDPVSEPYINMTCRVMEKFGVPVERSGGAYQVAMRGYIPQKFEIEGDWSSASFLHTASFLTGIPIDIINLDTDSLQGDVAILEYLEELKKEGSHVFDLSGTPDLIAPLAVAAMFAKGPVDLVGARHARLKECDRICVLAKELSKIGGNITERPDGLHIEPGCPSEPAELDTAGDHRMAMAFGLVSLKFPTIKIKQPECVHKSYPHFWADLERFRIINR